jgi:hypothetical protein
MISLRKYPIEFESSAALKLVECKFPQPCDGQTHQIALIASQRVANRRQFRDSADLELTEAEKGPQSFEA